MWVEAISSKTNVSEEALWKIANSASRRYFEFTIPKADGTPRQIEHPSRALKAVQRLISRNIVSKAPVHQAATAYTKGSKIRLNAQRHVNTEFTTRLDFEDFFPSFDSASVRAFFLNLSVRQELGLTGKDIEFIVKIVCRNGHLVIGAPSSPKITNAMMFDFDVAAQIAADNYSVVYTRYADDIYLSSNDKGAVRNAESAITELSKLHANPILKIKEAKTLHLSRAGKRSVTGLIITPTGKISVGRIRKREAKTLTYLALNGKLDSPQKIKLFGLLSFIYDNEPQFIDSLSKKFGVDVEKWFKGG